MRLFGVLTQPPQSAKLRVRVVQQRDGVYVIDDANATRRLTFDVKPSHFAYKLDAWSRGKASFEPDASGRRRLIVKGLRGWLSVALLVLSYLWAMAMIAACIVVFVKGSWGWIMTLLFMCGPPLAWHFISSRFPIRARHAAIARTHLFSRLLKVRCGACEYDLKGAPTDAAGRSTCGECGAAWHVQAWQESLVRSPSVQPVDLKDQGESFVLLLQGKSRLLARLDRRTRATRLRPFALPSFRRELLKFRPADSLAILVVAAVALQLQREVNIARGFGGGVVNGLGMADCLGVFAIAVVLKALFALWRGAQTSSAEMRRTLTARGICSCCESPFGSKTSDDDVSIPKQSHADGMIECGSCGARFAPEELGQLA